MRPQARISGAIFLQKRALFIWRTTTYGTIVQARECCCGIRCVQSDVRFAGLEKGQPYVLEFFSILDGHSKRLNLLVMMNTRIWNFLARWLFGLDMCGEKWVNPTQAHSYFCLVPWVMGSNSECTWWVTFVFRMKHCNYISLPNMNQPSSTFFPT